MVAYDYHFMNKLYNEEELLEIDNPIRQVYPSWIEGSYGFKDRLSESSMFSSLRQSRTFKTTNDPNKTSLIGIGDAILLLKYNLLGPETYPPFQIRLGAGPKVPLDKNNVIVDNGLLLSPDLQLGSGAWYSVL